MVVISVIDGFTTRVVLAYGSERSSDLLGSTLRSTRRGACHLHASAQNHPHDSQSSWRPARRPSSSTRTGVTGPAVFSAILAVGRLNRELDAE